MLMGTNMTKDDFHIPFINGMIFVALVTVFSMVSSRFIVDYYMNKSLAPSQTIEYSSHESHDQSNLAQ